LRGAVATVDMIGAANICDGKTLFTY